MSCLHCGKKVSLVTRILKGGYCSEEHRAADSRSLNEIALARLMGARAGMSAERAAEPMAESEAEAELPSTVQAKRRFELRIRYGAQGCRITFRRATPAEEHRGVELATGSLCMAGAGRE